MTKNKEARIVPFWNYPELEVLLERQRAYTETVQRAKGQIVPWVFHRTGKPIKSFRGVWARACRQAGLPGAWVHDFRRCVVRRFELCHVPRGAAMKVTGHKTESVYQRYMITTAEDVAAATGTIAGYSEKLASDKAQAKQAGGEAGR
jgi:integrase